ncbi:hypothetical protein Ae201684P_021252 [Aphanomyces euteiches]|nr:hypothetical protein Ae201684P_021252 [Aphanomyces euteiches]
MVTPDSEGLTLSDVEFESSVCDLLTSWTPAPIDMAELAKEASVAVKSKEAFSTRLRRTISDLKWQIQRLEDQLDDAKLAAALLHAENRWERLARRQRNEVRKAMLLRQNLLDAVHENKAFIEKLTLSMHKKPRIHNSLTVNWCAPKLVSKESSRHVAIHAIAGYQLSLKDTNYITAGLVDQGNNFVRIRPQVNNGIIMEQIANTVVIPAPCSVVSEALWKAYSGEKSPKWSSSTHVAIEQLDESTVYERFQETREGVTTYANTIQKYFRSDTEHSIVIRSVLEDELVPDMAGGAVENESIWLTIEPIGSTSCRMTFLMHFEFDTKACPRGPSKAVLYQITSALMNTHVEEVGSELGILSSDQQIPKFLGIIPGFDSLIDRCDLMKAASRHAVGSAIQDYLQGRI